MRSESLKKTTEVIRLNILMMDLRLSKWRTMVAGMLFSRLWNWGLHLMSWKICYF